MGFKIYCCGKKHGCRVFKVASEYGYLLTILKVLNFCPMCDCYKVAVEKWDLDGNKNEILYKNAKAVRVYNKLANSVLYEIETVAYVKNHGGFWLGYSEYGRKKKCYSNLSALKIGLFDYFDTPYV